MRTHTQNQPQSVDKYREWVATNSGLARDHPAIDTNQLLKPQLWRENEHLFDEWREW